MSTIINLTPHPITIYLEHDTTYTWPKCDNSVRLAENTYKAETVNGIQIYNKRFLNNNSLPPEMSDTYYIVSLPVAQAFFNRTDLLIPNELVRDADGNIIGCKNFARIE